MPITLDSTDEKIISIIKENGRISNTELAERISLSPTPSLRRLKRLEKVGAIEGYRAIINQQLLGNTVAALTFVTLAKSTQENAAIFEECIHTMPFVETCYTVSGSHDYVIKINAKSLQALEQTLKQHIAAISVIDKLETTIILNEL